MIEATRFPRLILPAPKPPARDPSALGVVRAFRTNVLTAWPRRAYEEAVIARPFFGRRSFLLNAPEAIRRVLVENHENYTRTPATFRILRPLIGNGLLLSEGPAWRHQRRTLAPAFTPRAMEVLVPHILAAAEEGVTRLEAMRGEPADLLAFTQSLALEIAGRTMFSLEVRAYGAAMRQMLARYERSMARPHFLDLILPPTIPSPHDLLRRRFGPRWMALIESIMAARGASAVPTGAVRDLLDLLLAARDPETGAGFSHAQLRDQVATLILAGHETTALALFWALTVLARAPELQDALAEEAAAAPERPRLSDLPLARAVLDETLRLYPPAFAVVRAALGPDRVAGLDLRRGDVVVIAPWVLHRHRRLWDDPCAFDPARFLPGAPPPDRFAYLPFGAGPRVCIGAPFALAEAVLVLALLLRRLRVELVENARPPLPVGIITLQPDHRPAFRVSRR